MPARIVGTGIPVLNQLVRQSVAPATWTAYGKAWDSWWEGVGEGQLAITREERLSITLQYLSRLRQEGVSGVVARHRITGISFHFQLRGWENIGQNFLVAKTLQG